VLFAQQPTYYPYLASAELILSRVALHTGKQFGKEQDYLHERQVNTLSSPRNINVVNKHLGEASGKPLPMQQEELPALPLFAWHPAGAHISLSLGAASTALECRLNPAGGSNG
jgi:hypothetical protein